MASGPGGQRRRSRNSDAGGTVAGLIDSCTRRLARSGVYFGHGTGNARDEAAALVFHVMGLDHADALRAYTRNVTVTERAQIEAMLESRISGRRPLPYLTGEAWFAGLRFHVDERVLIPRSPFAELIAQRFEPWLDPGGVRRILEIGTGSGCIAVALAFAFPDSRVVATDISADALAVAARNVARHGVGDRVTLVEADLFGGLDGAFDLIVSNPPYVPEQDMPAFPPEYGYEPRLALVSGADGMETPARILHHAAPFLTPRGWLALEVGAGIGVLEARFPAVPFLWPDLLNGGEGIALVSAADLRDSLPANEH
ncbi:MAG: 50S ribosomal protein L3 N(5)-glutamine methyltransferase [Gammaproteobacteria bacterium]|nr:50S ribosomal protein L3 N(5)-glutamine methyltransferase [Gammaproteobacteria bacterium]